MNIVARIAKDFPQIASLMDKVPVKFAPDWLKTSAVDETGLSDFGPVFLRSLSTAFVIRSMKKLT